MNTYFVYIMTNKHHTVLYIGVTNNLIRRVYEHKTGAADGFTKKYNCHKLVWYEEIPDVRIAIEHEKRMKKWKKKFKQNLINSLNPDWRDLYGDIVNTNT
ncbi:MAG: GIY-YIG nuclease family protein [Calditrichaeota bacterium]|nr:MAG: GIY-YIG nuclease family protein [Calditrichota bacterium]